LRTDVVRPSHNLRRLISFASVRAISSMPGRTASSGLDRLLDLDNWNCCATGLTLSRWRRPGGKRPGCRHWLQSGPRTSLTGSTTAGAGKVSRVSHDRPRIGPRCVAARASPGGHWECKAPAEQSLWSLIEFPTFWECEAGVLKIGSSTLVFLAPGFVARPPKTPVFPAFSRAMKQNPREAHSGRIREFSSAQPRTPIKRGPRGPRTPRRQARPEPCTPERFWLASPKRSHNLRLA
jgi:hypothetical protein